jgi:hypothetical protein
MNTWTRALSAVVLAMAAPPAFPSGSRGQEAKVIEISVANGKRFDTVKVQLDDQVELRIRSTDAINAHLHGYDLLVRTSPDEIVTMRFRAKILGRFPLEAHASGKHHVLGYIEVHPR